MLKKLMTPTEEETLAAIAGIERSLESGDSVSVARKKHCGHSNTPLYKAVSNHVAYQPLFLKYSKQKGIENQYTKRAHKIIQKHDNTEFFKWIISAKGKRFYAINRLRAENMDPEKDLIISYNEDGMLQISSQRFGCSIFFKTSEIKEEFEKWNSNITAFQKNAAESDLS